ncbi:MAG: hypothetical protein ACRDAU_09615 [Clostridium sp.]
MSTEAKEKAFLIVEKFDKEKKCKCGRELSEESLIKTEIEDIFECPCGREYILIIDEKPMELMRYGFGYKNGIKIYKHIYYGKIENEKCIYSTENMLKESVTFNIHAVNEERKLTWIYGKNDLEFLNIEKEDFFNDFTMEDLKTFKMSLTRICEKRGIEPNYGDLMEGFLENINLNELFRFCKYLLGSYTFIFMVMEGFSYLIKENTLNRVDEIEKRLNIKKFGGSLEEIWGIDERALKYAISKRYNTFGLEKTRSFINRTSYYDFNKLIVETGLSIKYEDKIAILLENCYEVDRFSDYIKELYEEEYIEKNEALEMIYEIYYMSKELEIPFTPYMEGIKERYNSIVDKYDFKIEKEKKKILDKVVKNIEIKQISHKYNCKVLKTIKDFKEEERNGEEFGLSCIAKMKEEKFFIASIRSKKETEKILATLKIIDDKEVVFKSFENRELSKEVKDYLVSLAERNGWKI